MKSDDFVEALRNTLNGDYGDAECIIGQVTTPMGKRTGVCSAVHQADGSVKLICLAILPEAGDVIKIADKKVILPKRKGGE